MLGKYLGEGSDLRWYIIEFQQNSIAKNRLAWVLATRSAEVFSSLFCWAHSPHGNSFWRIAATREGETRTHAFMILHLVQAYLEGLSSKETEDA